MKMKVGTRIVMSIYIIVVIIMCLFVLSVLVGAYDSSAINNVANTIAAGSFWYKFGYGVVVIVLIVVGIGLLFFGVKREAPNTAKIASFENGSILITVRAIEELVQRYLREEKSVKEVHSNVISYSDFVSINANIAVWPDINIPDVTMKLQAGLREYIEKHTGIAVKEIMIMVMKIDESAKLPALS